MPKAPLIIALCIVALAGVSRVAAAQSYAAGYTKYQRADFKGAEKALTAALKAETAKDARAKTLKLLGICQFMLGDKTSAGATFRQALALKPELSIAGSEVLDEGVIDFFKKQKVKPVAAAPKEAAPPPPLPSTPPAPVKTAATAAKAPAGPSSKPSKKTLLKVIANVTGATVLIDGIIAGEANNLINVEPGAVEIEVQAPGYPPKRQKLSIIRDRETTISVTLSKPVPKQKPKPKIESEPEQDSKALAMVDADKPKAKPHQVKKAKDAYAPNPGDELFGKDPGTKGVPPSGRAAPAGDPAAEFDRDTGATPPQYSAPPGGQQQVYAIIVPQSYGQQGYGQQGYGQQGYAYQQPPPPPPPDDPYNPTYGPPGMADPGLDDDSGHEGRHGNVLLRILPFGVGQFANHDYLLGAFFLGSEAGALYYAYTKNAAATATQKQASQLVADRQAQGQDLSSDETAYVTAANSYIANQRQTSQYALAGFGVLWISGAIEAVVDDHPIKEKKAKRKRYSGFGLTLPDDVDGTILPVMRAGAAGTAVVTPASLLRLSWGF